MNILYRYEINYKTPDNETDIILKKYPVIKETEHTYFIQPSHYPMFSKKTKRVSKLAQNTYAYNTKEKAKKNFISRTMKRVSWYKYWIDECEKGLELIEKLTKKD